MVQFDDISAIQISLASPDQIRSWSHGEVTKAETINYRTLKPERDGLFCERIFGPVKDYECHCGKYKKIRYKGVICDKCGVEVAHSSVRRERMGHIELAAPVTHIWFAKLVPCWLGILLDLSPKNLESVIYFARYVVISVDEEGIEARAKELIEQGKDEDAEKIRDLKRNMLLNEEEYRDLSEKCGGLFRAGMGAESLLEVLRELDIEKLHEQLLEGIHTTSRQQYDKLSKKLQLVEALRESGNRPEWMIMTVLPVLPPSLRPVVQLDGGRFVISDLNDLYRRVINRNNRLRRLMSLGAPEAIIRNEKRMLQEAVDALIDNGRRGRVVTTGNNHALKSLSAMLAGKQGRFRQNLLGKRVDYSGRSVIVVGPNLKLHQCGIPRRVALELFKPFIMHKLMEKGFANNVKVARRQVERARPEVWDLLQEVVKERPVMLNRAPTLHRLSIQAFEPVLIDGDAFQLHPLVCSAFNADFDGDQMAVHVPLSKAAVQEVRERMLSVYNMLLPSNGMPVASPSLDIVLGCYYLTLPKPNAKGKDRAFSSCDDAKLAYDIGQIELGAEIKVRYEKQLVETTVGRIIFNEALPPRMRFQNKTMNKSGLRSLVSDCVRVLGHEATAAVLDNLKQLGFDYATKSGVSIAMSDIEQPPHKAEILREADEQVGVIQDQYERGFITEDERYENVVQVWMEATDKILEDVSSSLDRYGPIYMMATSGAKGNISQIRQMAGMRGLMTDPSGKIIDFPIKASFREGLTPMEYFVSTHGARKGLADTALRTSESGYLTRRLVDVSQDVIVTEVDCGTTEGTWIRAAGSGGSLPPFSERMLGYLAASPIVDPGTGEVIVARNEEIDEDKAKLIIEAGIDAVYVRSPLNCRCRFGICQYCYGRDLATRSLAKLGTAVGVIAAQSVGEPGTQLTLRTFHTGGVVGSDITTGLPRVEELFEARTPKGRSVLCGIDGTVEILESEEGRVVRVTNSMSYDDEYPVPATAELLVEDGQVIEVGTMLFRQTAVSGEGESKLPATVSDQDGVARVSGRARVEQGVVRIRYTETEEREYPIPAGARLTVQNGDKVTVGQQLTEGVINPHSILRIMGKEATQQYIIDEIQKVYCSQGVSIHDKHIATIVRQMLRRVEVLSSGDTELLPGELVDRFDYEDVNVRYLAEGGEPATAQAVLLGITRASLNKDSWLAAASFQETNRVLAAAALRGKVDRLRGLKENVILGKLIPSQGVPRAVPLLETPADEDEEQPLGLLS
ncbi:MAG: DNA-directed RNA polymerase subunit beta' [Dehalococcoidia bacterium]|jgi:DNA-directed RNA polymerase subunit beta'|nr:DNA-directed RNA polymerase subunit beta' [Dehalococcoidia bacterium]